MSSVSSGTAELSRTGSRRRRRRARRTRAGRAALGGRPGAARRAWLLTTPEQKILPLRQYLDAEFRITGTSVRHREKPGSRKYSEVG
jgi:hypothetical protein